MSLQDTLTIKKKKLNYDKDFLKIADDLMNKHILVINGKDHRICEIEYYLTNQKHRDPFIHGDPHQNSIGKWYFHRQNGGRFRGGTFKGMDLTFGDGESSTYGGILIRSIKSLDSNKITEGPCRVVDYILRSTKKDNIYDLVKDALKNGKQNQGPIFAHRVNNKSVLYLKKDDKNQLKKTGVYTCPRVGLTLKNGTKEKEGYIMRDYRYLIFPEKIKKYKFGIILSKYKDDKDIDYDEMVKEVGSNKKVVERVVGFYDDGKQNCEAKDFYNKRLNVKELCQLYGCT